MDLASVTLGIDEATILLIIAGFVLLNFLLLLIVVLRQRRLLRRYRSLLAGGSKEDLEQWLLAQASQIQEQQAGLQGLEQKLAALSKEAEEHLQKLAVIRYNPFPDSGSDLSFSVALLDSHDNGVVISSLFSRTESRTYAKPIQAGKSSYALTEEEKQVLAKAGIGRSA